MPSESVVGEEAHCRALGVPVDATLEQIKAAYRKEALRNHPDKNPGSKAAAATENFMRVKAAYDYLLRVRSAGSVGGGSVATRTAATDFTTGDTSNTSTSNTSTWNTSNTSSSSFSFSTFSTAPPNGQPPIRHDLLLTLEEYLHGTVKKLLISPPPTAAQQQKKLLEVRVQAGATPGTVLYGRILRIGLVTFSAQACGAVLPEDRSIAVVLGDRPHPKFSRYPWPGSPNLKVVYQLTEAEVRRAVANNTTYSKRSITLVLAIPTLGVNTATPGPFISHRIMLHQLQTPPPVCITLNYQGLLMAPGSALRGYLYVELKPPPGHTFESLIAAAMLATTTTTTTTAAPAPEPPSTPFRNSTNKTQQQQQQQKTPSRAKSKVAKQPKPPKLRQSKRILKKNQPAPPPPSPPSPTSQPPSSPPTPQPESQQPPPPPPPSSSSSSPEVITIDSPTVRHSSPDVSSMLSCAYCARRFLYRRILIEHERKHRCIYATCTFSSEATADVVKHVLGCSKGQ